MMTKRFVVGMICLAATAMMWSMAAQQDTQPKSSAQVQDTLRSIIDSAHDSDLRWPDFPLYSGEARKFYESAGYGLAWIDGRQPTPQALALIGILQNADQKGLNAEDYDGPRWAERLARLRQSPSDSDLARFDLALTISVGRYAAALHLGRVNPISIGLQIDVRSEKHDLSRFLRTRLVNTDNPAAVLQEVEPAFAGYRRALETLHRYMELARQDDGEKLPATKKPVDPGQSYPMASRLVRLLRLLGDLPANAEIPPGSDAYAGVLVEAVKRFQDRHGLEPDGRLGTDTINQLNTPLSFRVRQLQLTLERWRWFPHSFSQPPVIVNLPEFRLRATNEQAKVVLSMNVIVGKAYGHKSPVFQKEMKYIVFRPYWDVPSTIQRTEMVPSIEKDRNYVARKSLEVVTPGGQVVTDGPISDEVLLQLRAGKLRIRQKPGPTNSLGLVKLIFPNEDNVYLHGTNVPELFSRSRRDFSHGCIRVEKPADLAAWALRHNPGWDLERVEAAMNGSEDNVRVNLVAPLPVLIVYGTVAVDESNQAHFFQDIYGYDLELERALAKGYPYP
jgi:murein L,D-transpeptidase YcbB/YkuD